MHIYMHEIDQQATQGKSQEAHAESKPQDQHVKGNTPEAHVGYIY